MDPHHGRPQLTCKSSSPCCTIPTGDQPPNPRSANGGSLKPLTVSNTVIAGASTIHKKIKFGSSEAGHILK